MFHTYTLISLSPGRGWEEVESEQCSRKLWKVTRKTISNHIYTLHIMLSIISIHFRMRSEWSVSVSLGHKSNSRCIQKCLLSLSSLNPFNHSALCFLIRLPTAMPISVNCDVRFRNICTCLPVSFLGKEKRLIVVSFSHTENPVFVWRLASEQIHQFAFF